MKRTLSGIAAAALVLGTMAPAAFAATSSTMAYTDLGSYSWAAGAINSLTLKGDIHGFADGQYRPASHVTRGQFLAYFMNTMKSVTGVTPGFDGTYYNDVKRGNWAYEYVGAAQKAGWIKSYWMDVRVGGNFNENYHASRGDAASLFVAAMENAGVISSTNGMTPLAYATSIGLFNGIPSGTNTVYLNRAAAAVVLKNMWTYVNGGTLTTQPVASSETLSLSTKTLVANGTSTDAVTAAVVDANGNPVSGVTVNFSSTNSSVATITSSAVTNSEGMATATITAGTTVGSTGIVASVSGVAPQVKLLTTTPANTAPMLSNLTVMGEAVGNGSSNSPAVALTNNDITVNTTLTDAAGNPMAGVNLTYTLGSVTGVTATSNGVTLTATGDTYTVATGSNGTAPLTLAYDGAGLATTVSVAAPFANANAPASLNVAWAEPGAAVMSPTSDTLQFGSATDAAQGVVPVTVTVLPSYQGATVSGIPVVFTLATGNVNGALTNAFFATSSAGNVSVGSKTFTAYTNAQGQATAYVNDVNGASNGVVAAGTTDMANVTATYNGTPVVNAGTSTATTAALEWATPGYPASLSFNQTTGEQETAGTNQTLSGQVTDVLGNPVANATLELSSSSYSNGTNGYVADGATTDFTSTNYETTTTNSAGDFSFVVNDSTVGTDNYQVNYVAADGVSTPFSTAAKFSIDWTQPTTVASLGISTFNNLQSSYSTSVPTTSSAYTPASTNQTFYVAAYNSLGQQITPAAGQTITLQVTANHGDVYSVNGNVLSSVSPTATVTLTHAAPVGSFTVTDTTSEADVFTVQSGSATATANVNFSASSVSNVTLNPGSVVAGSGQSVPITFTALDASGNPVPNATLNLVSGTDTALTDTNMYITAVDGQQLTQYLDGSNEPTPVPLFATTSTTATGYNSVFANGISATNFSTSPAITLTTGSNGQVTVTLQSGNVPYWSVSNQVYVNPYTNNASSSAVYVYSGGTSVGSGTFQW